MTRDLHIVGKDFPDIVASKRGINLLVEVKSPGNKLSKGQEVFFATWLGPKIVAYSGEEAIQKARELYAELQEIYAELQYSECNCNGPYGCNANFGGKCNRKIKSDNPKIAR